MSSETFKCTHCGEESGFGKQALHTDETKSANPYANETRKYRCEKCSRINEITLSGYDWTKIDRANK